MTAVLLIIHLLIAIALVGVVLLQRSEGGALGIGGGGGGGGGMFSGRGAANVLTRTTAILAAAFFATSILLTIFAQQNTTPDSVFEGIQTPGGEVDSDDADTEGSALPNLPPMSNEPAAPQVPDSQ